MTGPRRQQRGIVAVLVAIGMLALLIMAGLAFDTGLLVLNKSRLQSAVDAAALAAAKIIDQPGGGTSETLRAAAQTEALRVFHDNVDRIGFLSAPAPTVQFSSTLNPFADGTTPREYVRVIAEGYSVLGTFSQLLGIPEIATGASAVAGRSAPIPYPCDLFPVAVCAVPGASAPHYGYPTETESGHTVTMLKLASGGAGSTFGPGNFQLIRLGGTGASVVREKMAGGELCADAGPMQDIDPNPGNVVGPVAQGMNTRFGLYIGPMAGTSDRYPPDRIVTPAPDMPLDYDGTNITWNGKVVNSIADIGYSYANYVADGAAGHYTNSSGVADRRVVAIPIVDCTNAVPGTSSTLPRKGFACFFLLQPARHSGSDSWIFGEFIDECEASGSPGPTPGEGPYKIVLHNDPDSKDS